MYKRQCLKIILKTAGALTVMATSAIVHSQAASAHMMTCVNTQVAVGLEGPPSIKELQAVLPRGGCVRDILSWANVEKSHGVFTLDSNGSLSKSFNNIAAAGMSNLLLLGMGNSLYRDTNAPTADNRQFPQTPAQIAAFTKYAVWAVSNDGAGVPDGAAANVPSLYGVSIWNELNNNPHDGIYATAAHTKDYNEAVAYANLMKSVGPAIQKANPKIKIIIGATIGFCGIDVFFDNIFNAGGLGQVWGLNDPNVYLDVHPYLQIKNGALHLQESIDIFNSMVYSLRNPSNHRLTYQKQGCATVPNVNTPPIANKLFATEYNFTNNAEYNALQAELGQKTQSFYQYIGRNILNNGQSHDFAGAANFELTGNYKPSADYNSLARDANIQPYATRIDFNGKLGLVDVVKAKSDGIGLTTQGASFVAWWQSLPH